MNKRREEILREIPPCDTLCDVGCDHGYVGYECLKRKIAGKVIFSDISEPSLNKARQLVGGDFEVAKSSEFVVANGLAGVCGKGVQTCVIAGMGGEEIIKILAANPSVVPQICVLQPMSEVDKLREFLCGGFEISVDRLFYDRDKYYNLIVASKSQFGCKLSAWEVAFGKTNLASPSRDFIRFAKDRLKRQINIKNSRNTPCGVDDEVINFLSDVVYRFGE